MLRFLKVADLAVVRSVSLDLDEGLTVLTGETGAGKSILVDALTLLLGARASGDLVRTGAGRASVEGIFRVERNRAAAAAAAELGAELDDGDLILRREVGARSRAFVNGTLQPVGALKKLGWALADVHGQHEHVRLLDAGTHLDLLDHAAGTAALRGPLAAAHERVRALSARLQELHEGVAERRRRADFLRYELTSIEEAKLRDGEDDELARDRRLLADRSRIVELTESGYQALYAADGAILERLTTLKRELEELSAYDEGLGELRAQAEAARAQLEDVALTLRDFSRNLPRDAARLEEVEERLALLERLKVKYGPALADVIRFAGEARAELDGLEVFDEERDRVQAELDDALRDFERLALEASTERRRGARGLEERVERELADLAMEKTRFLVRVELDDEPDSRVRIEGRPVRYGPAGVDRVEFDVSTNVGEEPRPLGRVASGGELSRILLALRAASGEQQPDRVAVFHGLEAGLDRKVAVFDEVDAGIGGRVAYVLARKLKALARGRQVLCITHLAPVAAAADHHLRVKKQVLDGRTEVSVEPLVGKARVAELGRMIGGEKVTEAVRRHVRELLAMMKE